MPSKTVSITTVLGRDVRATDGVSVGYVHDVLIDHADGKTAYMVVEPHSRGDNIAIRWDAFEMDTDLGCVRLRAGSQVVR